MENPTITPQRYGNILIPQKTIAFFQNLDERLPCFGESNVPLPRHWILCLYKQH